MIECSFMYCNNQILVQTNENINLNHLILIQNILRDLNRKAITKIIQLNNFRLGVNSIKINNQMISFACMGQDVQPKYLLDCASSLTEYVSQNFYKEFDNKENLQQIDTQFKIITERFNHKIENQNKILNNIDKSLQQGIDQSKESLQMFLEREENLNEINKQSQNLANQAQCFQKGGQQFKQDILKQKYKTLATLIFSAIFFFLILTKIL